MTLPLNPLLARLHPYPFERWRELTARIVPTPALRPIGLGIGEPRHATPPLIEEALVQLEQWLASQVDGASKSVTLINNAAALQELAPLSYLFILHE